jgi:hypothetical protein
MLVVKSDQQLAPLMCQGVPVVCGEASSNKRDWAWVFTTMAVTTRQFIIAPRNCQVISAIRGAAPVHRPVRGRSNTVECEAGKYPNKGNQLPTKHLQVFRRDFNKVV